MRLIKLSVCVFFFKFLMGQKRYLQSFGLSFCTKLNSVVIDFATLFLNLSESSLTIIKIPIKMHVMISIIIKNK